MIPSILFIFLLGILTLPSSQIYLTTTSRPSCFTIEEEAGMEVKFSY